MGYEAKITSKGQLTLPSALRAECGLGDGDTVEFYLDARGRIVMRPLNASPTAVFEQFKGEVMKGVTASDDEAIAEAVIQRDARSRGKRGVA